MGGGRAWGVGPAQGKRKQGRRTPVGQWVWKRDVKRDYTNVRYRERGRRMKGGRVGEALLFFWTVC